MLEPAQRRKPVLFGPHTENFREGAELLRSAGAAVVVRDAHELAREAERLLKDPACRQAMGEAGYAAVASRQGALATTMALIERLPDVEGVIVSDRNEVLVSSGLKNRLVMLAPPTDAP